MKIWDKVLSQRSAVGYQRKYPEFLPCPRQDGTAKNPKNWGFNIKVKL